MEISSAPFRKKYSRNFIISSSKENKLLSLHYKNGEPPKTKEETRDIKTSEQFFTGKELFKTQRIINSPIFLKRASTIELKNKKTDCFVFQVEKGNNSELVQTLLGRKKNWVCYQNNQTSIDFKWSPSSLNINYNTLSLHNHNIQCVNHLEFHREISNKFYLFQNLKEYCYARGYPLFSMIPLSFTIDLGSPSFQNDFRKFIKFFMNENYEEDYSHDNYKKQLLKDFNNFNKRKSFFAGKNMWLIKPAGKNRGQGIFVFNNLEKLNEFLHFHGKKETQLPKNTPKNDYFARKYTSSLSKYRENLIQKFVVKLAKKKSYSRRFVIQKYLEVPLLINKRKFDIRAWVLFDQKKNLYLFKEGYIRLSSEIYDLEKDENIDNQFIHLTNNAIQKNSISYEQYEPGNQMSFPNFQKYFEKERFNFNFKSCIMPKLKNIIKLTFESVKEKLDKNERSHSFEIFGFDFMIDNNLDVWLIEVNTNPCLEESSPLLKTIIPRMLDDAFKLTVDKIFGEKNLEKNFPIYPVPGYNDFMNMWEYLDNLGFFKV